MGIKIYGSLELRGSYEVELEMTETEFNELSFREQNEVISDAIDWREWMDNSDVNDLDVYEIEEGE